MDGSASLLVACLCAEWCGTCREYRPLFEQVGAGSEAAFRWVDIEDHDDALGNIDVENFPTLLIARGDAVLFYGPLLPHASTLARLVQSAEAGALAAVAGSDAVGLPARVRSLFPEEAPDHPR